MASRNSLLQLNRVIPPDRDLNFRATAQLTASRKDLKSARNNPKLRRCGSCKGAWYCSKECQTKDWPQHKQICNKVEGSGILKLLNTFYANDLLMMHLQACLVFNFNLIRKPAINEPFLARVDLGIEPSDITTCYKLCNGFEVDSEKIEGMLQINAVTPRRLDSTTGSLTPQTMEVWRRAREKADRLGFVSDSVGLIEYQYNNARSVVVTATHILAPVLDIVKEARPFVRVSGISGRTEHPMNATSCIEAINLSIRSDAHNRWLLRTDMTKADIDVIRDVGRGVDREAVHIFKEKMAREPIYRPHLMSSS